MEYTYYSTARGSVVDRQLRIEVMSPDSRYRTLEGEYPPLARYAFQNAGSSIGKVKAGARYQVLYRARYEYFAGFRNSGHTRADMHR